MAILSSIFFFIAIIAFFVLIMGLSGILTLWRGIRNVWDNLTGKGSRPQQNTQGGTSSESTLNGNGRSQSTGTRTDLSGVKDVEYRKVEE